MPSDGVEQHTLERVWSESLQAVSKQHEVPFPRLGSILSAVQDSKKFSDISCSASIGYERLIEMTRASGVSARPLVQSAWATAFSAYLEAEWVLLGDSVSGRTIGPNLNDIVGPLHAALSVPIHVKPSLTRTGLIRQVDELVSPEDATILACFLKFHSQPTANLC